MALEKAVFFRKKTNWAIRIKNRWAITAKKVTTPRETSFWASKSIWKAASNAQGEKMYKTKVDRDLLAEESTRWVLAAKMPTSIITSMDNTCLPRRRESSTKSSFHFFVRLIGRAYCISLAPYAPGCNKKPHNLPCPIDGKCVSRSSIHMSRPWLHLIGLFPVDGGGVFLPQISGLQVRQVKLYCNGVFLKSHTDGEPAGLGRLIKPAHMPADGRGLAGFEP